MIFYKKTHVIAVLFIVGILFIPSLLLYFFGYSFISHLSLLFMIAGAAVLALQFLSFNKIDFENRKFLVTHGWLYPKEFRSIPFEDIRQLSLGFMNASKRNYHLLLELNDHTSVPLTQSSSLGPLKARAEKIADLMKKRLVDETHLTKPVRKMSNFPNDATIQVYLIMGYGFVAFPLFLVVALFGSLYLSGREMREAQARELDILYERYQPAIDRAEALLNECETVKDGYLSGKIAIRLPESTYKDDWRAALPDRYKPGIIRDVNTVILTDSFEHDWGTSSGTIVLIKERQKFHYYVTSDRKEKKLGSTIRAENSLWKYLNELPSH